MLTIVQSLSMAIVCFGTRSPQDTQKRFYRLSKSINAKRPFEKTRIALESVRLQVSRDDIQFSVYAPLADQDLHDPEQHKLDNRMMVGLNQFLWGLHNHEADTRTDFSEILLPNEVLRVHAVVSKSHNRQSGLVERRRLIPVAKIGNQVLASTVEWYRSVRTPRMAVVTFVDDCDQSSIHVLVKQFMFLTFLEGSKVATSPIFLSPPRSLGFRQGCLRTRRFLVVKQYGPSLAQFLQDYPVKPIPLLETLQIGRKLLKVIYKLHIRGIAHGGICAEAFVFASGTDLRKGFRLTNFSNAFSDERGLSRVALGDLQMLFSVIGDMSPDILETVMGKKGLTHSPELKSPKLRESLICIHTQLWNQMLVSDVDYRRIFECFDLAIGILSNNF